jgi:Transposase DDE domain
MEKTAQALLKAIQLSEKLIHSLEFFCEVRLKPAYFSREGKMGFVNTIAFMLNNTKKSLQFELDHFFNVIHATECSISKQAFSEARQKLSPKAFIILFQAVVQQFYESNDFKTYRDFRILAIDGSTLELQNTEELRNAYGFAENRTHQIARARISALYDVENHFLVDALIDRYDIDEQDFAIRHIAKLLEYGLKNDLILFDRGYPSKKLIALLMESNIKFLMRVSSQFIKEVNQVKEPDKIVKFKYKRKTYRIRVIKFILDSGNEEILITSLTEDNFTIDDFKQLYFKRWGIESKYSELKHKLEIENFSGVKPIAVEQDFYASMYLTNMDALAKSASDEQIQARNQDKDLKYKQQTNTNILIGKLKDKLIFMVLEPNARKRNKMLRQLIKELSMNVVPIRPGRTWPRIKKTTRDRYPMNQKKCL